MHRKIKQVLATEAEGDERKKQWSQETGGPIRKAELENQVEAKPFLKLGGKGNKQEVMKDKEMEERG